MLPISEVFQRRPVACDLLDPVGNSDLVHLWLPPLEVNAAPARKLRIKNCYERRAAKDMPEQVPWLPLPMRTSSERTKKWASTCVLAHPCPCPLVSGRPGAAVAAGPRALANDNRTLHFVARMVTA